PRGADRSFPPREGAQPERRDAPPVLEEVGGGRFLSASSNRQGCQSRMGARARNWAEGGVRRMTASRAATTGRAESWPTVPSRSDLAAIILVRGRRRRSYSARS